MIQKTTSHEVASQASDSIAESGRAQTSLDYRYREIGILAVAAAVRYAGGGKDAAPSKAEIEDRFVEYAA